MPDPVSTASFGGVIVPHDTQQRILNLLVDGAPFARSLTRQPTNRSEVAWPTASPTGWAWVPELGPIPEVAMGDDALIVTVCKIAGILKVSNEAISDSTFNVTNALGTMLGDSLSRDLDLGLLNGDGTPPNPDGVIPNAPEVDAADLLTGVSTAMGEIGDAGGSPDTLALSGAALAAENAKTGASGLFYPAGFAAAMGLTPVVVPELATPLVYDSRRCFFVLNGQQSQVDISNDAYFAQDAAGLRIKARVAAGIPVPNKSIRKLTITTVP